MVSFSNTKSAAQKATDEATRLQIEEFCQNAEPVRAQDVFTSEWKRTKDFHGEDKNGLVRVLVEGVDLAGKVVVCPTVRARGVGKTITAGHRTERAIDGSRRDYAAANKLKALRYEQASEDYWKKVHYAEPQRGWNRSTIESHWNQRDGSDEDQKVLAEV